jgi:NAD(P)H-dependent FMN reductase
MQPKILGVSGSLRPDSLSRRALVLGLEFAHAQGAEIRLLDLNLVDLPMFRPDARPSGVIPSVTADVAWADAFLLATPDYHGAMSGAIKNFLDYHWDELAGKVFGCLGASHADGPGAIDQMQAAVRQCHGWCLPYAVSAHDDDFDHSGIVKNPRLAARLEMLARDVRVYGALIRSQFQADLKEGRQDTFAARYGRGTASIENGNVLPPQRFSFARQLLRNS